MDTRASVVIDPRFCGPPDRGNGGITAGLLAAHLAGAVEVTLRRPAPLGSPMGVQVDGDRAVLRDGDDVVAEAVTTTLDVEPPAPVPFAAARTAAAGSPVLVHPDWHPFPGCFVCGPDRRAGDGLRVHPGLVPEREVFAAPVAFPADLADADGLAPGHLVWAALDCPSSFVMYRHGRPAAPYVLGRIAVRIDRRPSVDAPAVAMSWSLGADGRKLFAASALHEGTELLAVARATWISV